MAKCKERKESIELSFLERKELIELEHKLKMEELTYIRKTEEIKHDLELQRIRIKTAEVRRTMDRKENWQNHNDK